MTRYRLQGTRATALGLMQGRHWRLSVLRAALHLHSPWFGHDQQPWESGDYIIDNGGLSPRSPLYLVGSIFRYWDNDTKLWMAGGRNSVWHGYLSVMGQSPHHRWKGLASPPDLIPQPEGGAL